MTYVPPSASFHIHCSLHIAACMTLRINKTSTIPLILRCTPPSPEIAPKAERCLGILTTPLFRESSWGRNQQHNAVPEGIQRLTVVLWERTLCADPNPITKNLFLTFLSVY